MGCKHSDSIAANDSAESKLNEISPSKVEDRTFLIHLIRGSDIPKLDVASESDPYVELKVFGENGHQKGTTLRSLYRMDNANPIWNCYRHFRASASTDTLCFELWDKDFVSKDALIGSAEIKLSSFPIHDARGQNEDDTQRISVNLKSKKQSESHRTTIWFAVRALAENTVSGIQRKTLFFIRHGESEWNSAQHNRQIHRMYSQIDHPLNEEGVAQALDLNKSWKALQIKHPAEAAVAATDCDQQRVDSKDLDDFLAAQIVYASPLCRATQTAILTLLGHPCLEREGLCFARNLREIKTAGGADTMANKTGYAQFERAVDHIVKCRPALKEMVGAVRIDLNDSGKDQKWWSSSVDREQQFHRRLQDFMFFLRFKAEDNVICVGHSLWFRGFFRRYIGRQDAAHFGSGDLVQGVMDSGDIAFDGKDPKLMADLQSKKVENAGCVRVDIAFSDRYDDGLRIEDVRLLFGTELV